MKRESLLEKGYSEEQVTELLNMWHESNKGLTTQVESMTTEVQNLKNEMSQKDSKIAGLTKLENEYNSLKQSQLTEAEKQEIAKKETEKNLIESRKILNTAKAKEIFSEIGGIDENVLKAIVTDDENSTLANANAILSSIKSIKEETVNKVKQDIATIDVKPSPSNVLDGADMKMTWEKFDKLSSDEQVEFQEKHPEEFANL